MVTRRDLRAERDFYAPMTGGTQIRYADAPKKKDTYGSKVAGKLSDIKNVKSTRVNPVQAIFAKVFKTDDPFTQVKEKKSYAPQEENNIGAQIEGLAGAAQDAIGEGVSQVKDFARSTGQRAAKRRADDQAQRASERAADKADFNKRLANVGTSFDKQLGDFRGSMGTQSERLAENERLLSGLKTDSDMYRKSTSDRLQNLSRTFDTKYKSIGDQVQGIKADSSMYRAGQDAKYSDLSSTFNTQFSSLGGRIDDQEKRVSNMGTTITGIGTREFTNQFSEKQQPKQVSNLPSNYKATEAAAFKKAEAFQKAKGIAQRNPNVSINKEGRAEATNNSGVARAQASAVNRKIDQKSISQVKSENKQSMQDAARKRNEAFQKAKKQKASEKKGFGGPSTTSKPSAPKATPKAAVKKATAQKSSTNSGSKRSSRGAKSGGSKSGGSKSGGSKSGGSKSGGSKSGGSKSSSRGARGGSSSRSRGGASKSSSRRGRTGRGGRRGGRRCDIRCKFDISVLTNLNLIRDDLAEVAYFVKELQEV